MDPTALAPIRVCVWRRLLYQVWRVGLWSVDVGSVQSRGNAIYQTQRRWDTRRSVWFFSMIQHRQNKVFQAEEALVDQSHIMPFFRLIFLVTECSLAVAIKHPVCPYFWFWSNLPLSAGPSPFQLCREGSWSCPFQMDVPQKSTSSWPAAGH